MESLSIYKFKAFDDAIEITTSNRKNILLCGENGAGKTSVFDALRYVFYHERMMSIGIEVGDTPIDKAAKKQQNEDSYVNKKHMGESIEIKFNGSDCQTLNYDDYEVYMISQEDIRNKSSINLREVLYHAYITHKSAEVFLTGYAEDTVRFVNETLINKFGDNIQVEIIDEELNCKLKGSDGLESKDDLQKYFNEAKLSIVFLLILFSYIRASSSQHKRRILVLDDVITSMDMAYRISLIKYIMDEFVEYQKIIFTHSPAFFNLFAYFINTKKAESTSWIQCQLYAVDGAHFIHEGRKFKNAQDYEDEWKTYANDDKIGNDVRQYIEVLATELNQLYHLTVHEGTKEIIDRIHKDDMYFYFKVEDDGSVKNVYDLVLEVENIIKTSGKVPSMRCSESLKLITEYRNSREYNQIKDVFRDVELYQKVILHPSSHGTSGLRHFTNREVLYAIGLAKKLEFLISQVQSIRPTGDVYCF